MTRRKAAAGAAALAILGLVAAFFAGGLFDFPRPEEVRASYRPSDMALLDRRGRLLQTLRADRSRRRLSWVELDDVSPVLVEAVLRSEDRRFFAHRGVDFIALASVPAHVAAGGRGRGASTIAMQLVGLLDPSLRRGDERRGIREKWRQMRAAWTLERQWTKREILEAYLNMVTFRGEVQGVGGASLLLFGKAPHALTRAEAVVLAASIRGPNAPLEVLTRRAGALAADSEVPGLEEALRRATGHRRRVGARSVAPHVAHRLLPSTPPAADRVTTTLDLDVQLAAIAALRRNLVALRDSRVFDGAVLAVDNASGDVLAYVGSSADLSPAPHVDGVRARRQPGSALKPFLYGLAIEKRLLTAASLLRDEPLELAVATGLYRPENYDGVFRGLVSLRMALAGSLNIPAVRVLELVGEDAFVEHLRSLGFVGLTQAASYYGPALALGSAEVTLWELVNAYRSLANGGRGGELRLISTEDVPLPQRVYSDATAFVIADILADRDARSLTFGLENPLATRFWSAVKTGTSKDMRDNWCVGFSRRYTVGVWVGNFSGYPMGDVSGVSGAAPVWLEVMQSLHGGDRRDVPEAPAAVVRARVRPAAAAEPEHDEWFVAGTAPPGREQLLAASPPRIMVPVAGTIIAIDPDIPAAQQRVAFEASGMGREFSWNLDGRPLAGSEARFLWRPTPGRHELSLIDASGRELDKVVFRVRGAT